MIFEFCNAEYGWNKEYILEYVTWAQLMLYLDSWAKRMKLQYGEMDDVDVGEVNVKVGKKKDEVPNITKGIMAEMGIGYTLIDNSKPEPEKDEDATTGK